MRAPSLDELIGLTADDVTRLGPARADRVRVFRAVQGAGQAFRGLADELLRGDGLTSQQAVLLTVVRRLGRPTMGEAAAALRVTHQNVKQLALPLVAKGFLEIVVDPDDARARRLVTTKKNQRYWAARDPDDLAWLAPCFSALDDARCAELVRLLALLLEGLGRARGSSTASAAGARPAPRAASATRGEASATRAAPTPRSSKKTARANEPKVSASGERGGGRGRARARRAPAPPTRRRRRAPRCGSRSRPRP